MMVKSFWRKSRGIETRGLKDKELSVHQAKRKGYLQDLVYKLSKIGQAIDNNDLSAATSVLGGSTGTDWVKRANVAFSRVTNISSYSVCIFNFEQSIPFEKVPPTENILRSWILDLNFQLSSSPEAKTRVETFNSSLASLISAVTKNDVESSNDLDRARWTT